MTRGQRREGSQAKSHNASTVAKYRRFRDINGCGRFSHGEEASMGSEVTAW
jgi:hypothetical protein